MGRIRTSRNSQKTYHNILKKWLLSNRLESTANKYNQYFSQRIYFALILQEILKSVDGAQFLQSYREHAGEVRKKKEHQIRMLQEEKGGCEQVEHLRRVIQEL